LNLKVTSKIVQFVKNTYGLKPSGGENMSWKTLTTNNKQYKATLLGTSKEWEKKIKDIESRGHIILSQGCKPRGSLFGHPEGVEQYWAKVQIPVKEE
jgi:hypothetical protein